MALTRDVARLHDVRGHCVYALSRTAMHSSYLRGYHQVVLHTAPPICIEPLQLLTTKKARRIRILCKLITLMLHQEKLTSKIFSSPLLPLPHTPNVTYTFLPPPPLTFLTTYYIYPQPPISDPTLPTFF
ncbi:hypothetical protein GGP41_002910 [Bipolaris sorokiniana]|uniref:Uncharacterized protein n=1 Tax=Cochliobolus sativus TaxID=45130 RepID=A0A8H6DRN5_COCSA|nr:hypothetical protein GGP41_002910 [Bipolaris sorokiniana]